MNERKRGEAVRTRFESELSLRRLKPRLDQLWDREGIGVSERHEFEVRLESHWSELFGLLYELYGCRYDFFFHLESILLMAAEAWAQRSQELRESDRRRMIQPDWFTSERMVGGALYVDLFSENLERLGESIDYFERLGITYLHLMPLFEVRPGDNDGGYAISNYRSVDPRLGTIEDLKCLAGKLRKGGICLVLDFVFNHTSDEHVWAHKAQAGDREYQDFYYIFPDREVPDQYEEHLREIFPSVRRGNFSWHDGMKQWVWTTFNSFQWDLNYSNPAVFRAMAAEMFFIANLGVDVLRLDAIAFIWKRMGTSCENLPEAHLLVRAFNRLVRIVAPGLVFKSEAIVHPDDVVKYISPEECQISYNPTLMALLWESLATRKVELLYRSLGHRHQLLPDTAWVNYLRCHDDIGWTFDDSDAMSLGINAYDHRQFLNQFYTGRFEGSFARGIPFQENRETGDMRIAGTLASLAGLEQAIENDDEDEKELAIRRILLLYGVTLSIGGIPLIYLGEEWAMLNDYDFVKNPVKSGDTRWVHRPKMRWELLEEEAETSGKVESYVRKRVFRSLQRMIEIRKSLTAFSGQKMELMPSESPHVLCFVRYQEGHRVIVVANFSEREQRIPGNLLRTAGLGRFFEDVISESTLATSDEVVLEAYRVLWLRRI